MRAILWIFIWALVAFGIHFASFALIPATRGPTVRASHAVLHVAEKVTGEQYVTETNPAGEYPRDSLHASEPGQTIVIAFWALVYLLVFSLVRLVLALIKRSRKEVRGS
jgi:hypothetical protein